MITRKEYEDIVVKGLYSPWIYLVVSEKVDCCGYPERQADDWFVICGGRLDGTFALSTIGKIPLYRCHLDKNRAEEEANLRNEVANIYLKEIEAKEKK